MSREVEITVVLMGETDSAVWVYDGDLKVWLPKSQIDIEEGAEMGEQVSILVPEWLAIEKGLV